MVRSSEWTQGFLSKPPVGRFIRVVPCLSNQQVNLQLSAFSGCPHLTRPSTKSLTGQVCCELPIEGTCRHVNRRHGKMGCLPSPSLSKNGLSPHVLRRKPNLVAQFLMCLALACACAGRRARTGLTVSRTVTDGWFARRVFLSNSSKRAMLQMRGDQEA